MILGVEVVVGRRGCREAVAVLDDDDVGCSGKRGCRIRGCEKCEKRKKERKNERRIKK